MGFPLFPPLSGDLLQGRKQVQRLNCGQRPASPADSRRGVRDGDLVPASVALERFEDAGELVWVLLHDVGVVHEGAGGGFLLQALDSTASGRADETELILSFLTSAA